ncbi:MAG: Gfo/Idh/MocA family oxidoreductase [Clostridia bacterium]|nr:Gfo/Idh/MocA family oxidoreductase [Clostridia bacterium]
MKKIRIGQIGIGHNHGEEKMRAVRKYDDLFEVVGWCEEDEEWVKKRGNLDVYQGVPRMSREELLNSCEAMVIETDVWRMMEAARQCVDRGIHMHLDKPAGEDFDEYRRIMLDAKASGTIVQLGYMYRHNPAVQYILEKVRSGKVGEVLMVHTEMNTEHGAAFRKWLEHYQGGDMYIFGSHLLDLVLLLQGEPLAVHSFLDKTHFDGNDSYDSTLAVLQYPKATSTVRVTSFEANGYGRRQLVVVCEGGTFEVKPFERPTRLFWTPKGERSAYAYVADEIELPEIGGRYDTQIQDLAAMIRGEKPNPFDWDYEIRLHRLILDACRIK